MEFMAKEPCAHKQMESFSNFMIKNYNVLVYAMFDEIPKLKLY